MQIRKSSRRILEAAADAALSVDRLEPRTLLSSSKPVLAYQFDRDAVTVTVNEDAKAAVLQVTRSGASPWGTWKHDDDDNDHKHDHDDDDGHKKLKWSKYVRLAYEIVPLTAAEGQDFVGVSGEIKLRHNHRTASICIPILDDSLFEGQDPEKFKVVLKTVSKGRIGSRDEAVVSIIDNESAPPLPTQTTISINDVSVTEGDTGQKEMLFTVSLNAPATELVSVHYATSDITAMSGSDYESASGMLEFAPGQTTKTVAVSILGDKLDESDETLKLDLSGAVGGTITDAIGIGTIGDNDDPAPEPATTPIITIADRAAIEGDLGETALEFILMLSNASETAVTVQYQTLDGSATLADGDYLAAAGAVMFAPGEIVATVPVRIAGDLGFEDHEHLTLQLSDPTGATLLGDSAIGNILNDDDAPPFVTIAGDAVSEGNVGGASLVFTLTLTSPARQPTTVSYVTVSDSATEGVDFLPLTGTTMFAVGQTIAQVEVPTVGDMRFETDEQLMLRLVSAVNATVSPDDSATGKIVNDDAMPLISIADATMTEGNAGTVDLSFAVTLSNPSDQEVVVDFATADGSGTLAGSDYLSAGGQVVFLPGETSKTVTLRVQGDANVESDETVQLMLANPVGGTIADGPATGTIVNDDQIVDPGPLPTGGVTARIGPDPVDPSKTALFVTGTDKPENIRVIGRKNGAVVSVRADGQRIGSFSPTGRIIVQAGAGNDVVLMDQIILPSWLLGGRGKDRLTGGRGNDLIAGNEGRDLIIGGEANDSLIGGAGTDIIRGGVGDDLLIGAGVTVENDALALFRFATRKIRRDRIIDDQAPDTLSGNFGADRIFANIKRPGALDVLIGRQPGDRMIDL